MKIYIDVADVLWVFTPWSSGVTMIFAFFPRSIHCQLTLSSILYAEKVWKKQAFYYVRMEQTLIMSTRRSLIHS